MKRLAILALILSALTLRPAALGAQTLHALLFVNEKEEGRETDRTEDMRKMLNFWQDIAGVIGYDYEYSYNSDSYFTAGRVRSVISSLDVGAATS